MISGRVSAETNYCLSVGRRVGNAAERAASEISSSGPRAWAMEILVAIDRSQGEREAKFEGTPSPGLSPLYRCPFPPRYRSRTHRRKFLARARERGGSHTSFNLNRRQMRRHRRDFVQGTIVFETHITQRGRDHPRTNLHRARALRPIVPDKLAETNSLGISEFFVRARYSVFGSALLV